MSDTALEAKEGFTFGCDPELFVVDADERPVFPDFIPGTKDAPHAVEGGAVQRDGFAAEFNINPASNFKDFNKNIVEVMKQLRAMLPNGHKFAIVPSLTFPEEVFRSAPADAQELGCSPDLDAWTGYRTEAPCRDDNPYLCTAGGHLHVGWRGDGGVDEPQHVLNCRDLGKQLDWYLAAWSLRIDNDAERRKLYGKAGAIRVKPYGVEYRSLSNFWITEKDRRLAIWNRTQRAIADMRHNYAPDKYRNRYNDLLISSINDSKPSKELESIARYPVFSIAASNGGPIAIEW